MIERRVASLSRRIARCPRGVQLPLQFARKVHSGPPELALQKPDLPCGCTTSLALGSFNSWTVLFCDGMGHPCAQGNRAVGPLCVDGVLPVAPVTSVDTLCFPHREVCLQ